MDNKKKGSLPVDENHKLSCGSDYGPDCGRNDGICYNPTRVLHFQFVLRIIHCRVQVLL